YYLPDTAGTAYHREHVKSTVAAVAIDVPGRRLGYFHNQGCYQLDGEDFVNVFRLGRSPDPALLPPYVEFVKRRPSPALRDGELVLASLKLLRRQLHRLPEGNPFACFKTRLEADKPWLIDAGLETFHLYSFATLRQFGAAYELTATYLQWLQEHTSKPLESTIAAFTRLSESAKTMQFHLARSIARKKPLELSALDTLGLGWQCALTSLKELFL